MNGQYQPHIRRSRHTGFTLVELLVVIAIIAILVGLVSVAAVMALNKAKQVRIKSELDSLDMAIKAFKEKYGAYPPCDLRISAGATNNPNQNTLLAFVAQAFPRYHLTQPSSNPTLASTVQYDLTHAGIDTTIFRPDAALVFWLQGLNPDVTQPFTGVPTTNATAGTPTFTTTVYAPTPLFNFDQTRIKVISANASAAEFVYTPISQTSPYVYFDSSVYGTLTPGNNAVTGPGGNAQYPLGIPAQFIVANTDGSAGGTATPYVLDVNNSGAYSVPPDTFCNPTSFQIIAAGQDNAFGALGSIMRVYPAGQGYDTTGLENDNLSNFTDRSSLGDAIPN